MPHTANALQIIHFAEYLHLVLVHTCVLVVAFGSITFASCHSLHPSLNTLVAALIHGCSVIQRHQSSIWTSHRTRTRILLESRDIHTTSANTSQEVLQATRASSPQTRCGPISSPRFYCQLWSCADSFPHLDTCKIHRALVPWQDQVQHPLLPRACL